MVENKQNKEAVATTATAKPKEVPVPKEARSKDGSAVARLGKKQILLVRKEGEKEAASKLLFQTDLEVGISADSETTETKDVPVTIPGAVEYDFSATVIAAVGDKGLKMLKDGVNGKYLIELWVIDLQNPENAESPDNNKFYGTYYQAYCTSYTESEGAEDAVEAEVEFSVNGIGQEGYCTVTKEQSAAAQYAFRDTIAID